MKQSFWKKLISTAMSLVLAVGLCPALAYAAPSSTADADTLLAQEETADVVLANGTYKLPDLSTTLAMFNRNLIQDCSVLRVEGEKATVEFASTRTNYSKIAIGKAAELTKDQTKLEVPEGTNGTYVKDLSGESRVVDGDVSENKVTYRVEFSTNEVQELINGNLPIDVLFYNSTQKGDGVDSGVTGAWSAAAQTINLGFPKASDITLSISNEESMFKIDGAAISKSESGYLLTITIGKTSSGNASSYLSAFVGTLKEFNARANDDNLIERQLDSEKVSTYSIPFTLANEPDSFTLNLVFSSKDHATARRAEIDLLKGTIVSGNYKGVEDVSVSSSAVKADTKGTLYVIGYPKTKSSNASNEFTAELTMKLADGKATYDKVTIDTMNSPDGKTNSYTVAADGDAISVDDDGTVVLPFVNAYKKSQQIKDGTNATIKMHVADNAPYIEAGTWVSRSIAIDYETSTVTISGAELTPKQEEPKQEEPTDAGIEVGASEVTGKGATAATVKATSDTEVAYVAPVNKKAKKLTVPATVTVGGKSYKVTSISAKAFKGSQAKSLKLGKNISKVGKGALKGAKNLTKLTLSTSKLKSASMKNLLKGSKVKTMKVTGVSKKVKSSYKKWAKAYGVKVK